MQVFQVFLGPPKSGRGPLKAGGRLIKVYFNGNSTRRTSMWSLKAVDGLTLFRTGYFEEGSARGGSYMTPSP